jgi:ribosomal-protein-serine acetyltransferase
MLPISLFLTDDVITLRPLRAEDAFPMYEAIRESLEELKPWMSWAHDNYQYKEAQNWTTVASARWSDGSYFGFAITDALQDTFLGGCSLGYIHPVFHFCNLGYWIRTSRRGNDLAGRATRLAARFAFERLRLVRVEIVIATGNESSQKVAEKAGAHREGILHNRLVIGNDVQDAVMYSLLPSDFGLAAAS